MLNSAGNFFADLIQQRRGFCNAVDAEFPHDIGAVKFHGFDVDPHIVADDLAGLASHQMFRDFDFPLCQQHAGLKFM